MPQRPLGADGPGDRRGAGKRTVGFQVLPLKQIGGRLALAAAARGEETGIGSSEVYVGGGVNAHNIRDYMAFLHRNGWDGVVSLECSDTDENTRKSVEWMKGLVTGLGKKPKG
jgi:hypothetical protein